jgi:NTP pyrophosphatase (non-canonical NTP hydrolase)
VAKVEMVELHRRMTAHLFPAFSSEDERFLALALCGEAGELANIVKKRWRDGVDMTAEAREEIADIRVYLALIAKCFGLDEQGINDEVARKLRKVAERHNLPTNGT